MNKVGGLGLWLVAGAMTVLGGGASAQEVSSASDWGDVERRTYVFQAAQRGSLVDVAFGADASHVAVATSAGYVSVLDARTGVVLASRRLENTSSLSVDSLRMDPRGRWVLLEGSSEGSGAFSRRWDPNADTTRDLNVEAAGDAYGIEFAPDGSRFVGRRSTGLVVARANDGHVLVEAEHGEGTLSWPDRRAIVLHDTAHSRVEILDPAHLTVRATLDGVRGFAIDGPRHRLLARTSDAIVAIDLVSGRETARLARPLPEGAASPSLAVSTDGSRVAIADVPTSTAILALDGSEERTIEGRVLWLTRTRAIVQAADGTVGRHSVASGGRSSWVSRAPIERDALHIGPDGTAIFERASRLEISLADGSRSSVSTEGEHAVWWSSTDGARLAVGGRFGLDLWEASGARPLASCPGYLTQHFEPSGALITRARQCDLATGRMRAYAGAGPQVSDSGVVTGTDRGRVQLRDARRECYDEGCDPELTVEAGGRFVVSTQPGDETGEPADSRIFEVASGRVSVTLPAREDVVVDPQGRWAAAVSTQHVQLVLLPTGAELMHLGAAADEPYDRSPAPFAISGDGTRFAVRHQGSVRVFDATSGRSLATIAAPGADEIALSRDGSTIAIRTGRALRAGAVNATLAAAPEIAGTLAGVFCAGGHAFVLDRSGTGLPRRDLGTCLGEATLEGGGRFLVATSEGAVRVRRLSSGTELTFRSIRGEEFDAEGNPLPQRRVVHFVHDSDGRYWTDASGDVPVRVRDATGALVPLDPARADPQLLTRFFGGTG